MRCVLRNLQSQLQQTCFQKVGSGFIVRGYGFNGFSVLGASVLRIEIDGRESIGSALAPARLRGTHSGCGPVRIAAPSPTGQ